MSSNTNKPAVPSGYVVEEKTGRMKRVCALCRAPSFEQVLNELDRPQPGQVLKKQPKR